MPSLLVPPGAVESYVRVAGERWRVLQSVWQSDSPTPMLLLHGGGYDAAGISWYLAFTALGADRRLVAPDLPGCGGSRAVPTLGNVGRTVGQLVALLDAMGLGRVVVGGVSMGGDLALELALRHPERIAALVCVAPGGLVARTGNRLTHTLAWLGTRGGPGWMDAIARVSRPLVRGLVDRFVHDPATLPAEAVDEFVAEAHRPGGGVAYGLYNRACTGPTRMTNDKSRLVAGIGVPTLFLHGNLDPIVPLSGSVAAAVAMPDAEVVVVADTGHWVQLERPAEFEVAVRGFLGARGL